MISCLILLFPIFFISCFGLTETKHMSGGPFGWADALKSQRNLWGNADLKFIKLYKAELDLPKLFEDQFFKNINLSLTQKVDEYMQKAQDQLDNNRISDDKEEESISKRISNFNLNNFLSEIYKKRPKYLDTDNCDDYTNTKLFGRVFKELSCEDNDMYIGQILSYALIFMPILIMGILAFIFYIVFCFGCCCCCKPRDRTCPGVVSIVFFAVIAAVMLIAVIFHIVGAVYLINIINFFTSDALYDEVEEMIDLMEPTINNALSGINKNVTDSFKSISEDLNNVFGDFYPSLQGGIDSAIDNITLYSNFFNELKVVIQDPNQKAIGAENDYNEKSGYTSESNDCRVDYLQEIDIISYIDSIINQIEEQEISMNVSSEFSELTKPIVNSLNSAFSGLSDQLNIPEFSVSDLGSNFEDLKNIREKFDIDEYVPSWALIAAKAALFVVSFFMLLVLALQSCAFWTKNCCSRCIVGACCPCWFCSCCQCIGGAIVTMMGFVLIIINIIYAQGDDIVNRLVEKVTNEDKTLYFRTLDFSAMTDGMITQVSIDSLKIRDISVVKSFVDAKLDSSFADIIGFKDLPFRDIAILFNNTFSNAQDSLNPKKIVDPLDEGIKELTESIVQTFQKSEKINFTQLYTALSSNGKICDKNGASDQFNKIKPAYDNFVNAFDSKYNKLNIVTETFKSNTNTVPKEVGDSFTNVFGGFLKSIGSTVSKTINIIEGILEKVDAKFAIALFNIIRVRIFYQIMGYCMCVSISAHLFIIGLWAMTILLWVRRKGMAMQPADPTFYSYSISYSYSEDENESNKKKKKKSKKKGKNLSEDENTSDGKDVESVQDFQEKDVQGSERIDEEKDSDEEKSSSRADAYNPYEQNESTVDEQYNNNNNNNSDENTANEVSFQNDESTTANNDESSRRQKVDESENEFSFHDPLDNVNNNGSVDRSSTDDDENDDDQENYIF